MDTALRFARSERESPFATALSTGGTHWLPRIPVFNLLALVLVLALVDVHAASDERPLAPLDVSSPSATLTSFLEQASEVERAFLAYRDNPTHAGARAIESSVTRAAALFDSSELPRAVRSEVASASFGFLYDILLRLPPDDLTAALDARWEEETGDFWRVPDTEITIVQITEGEQTGSWLFSARTLRRLPEFHRAIIDFPLRRPSAVDNWHLAQSNLSGPLFFERFNEPLPPWLSQTTWLETPLWKLLLTLCLWFITAAVMLSWLQVLSRLTSGFGSLGQMLVQLSAPALLALMVHLARHFTAVEVNLSGGAFVQAERSLTLLTLYVAAAWAAWLMIRVISEVFIALSSEADRAYNSNLSRMVGRLLGIVAVALLVIAGLNEVGVPALGVVAGLGFGGFALALAGKSTFENLFGGLTLFADKPFRVGDFINYEDGAGVVESIGPRSSRMRGRDGTLTAVPNTELVTVRIKNYTARNKCQFLHTLGVRYETTPDQLKWLIHQIREMLASHPLVDESPGMPRVRLLRFGESAIHIEARADVMTTEYGEFLEVQQELLLEIMRLVDRAGSRLATRTQTLMLANDVGIDPESQQRADRAGRNLPPESNSSPDESNGSEER